MQYKYLNLFPHPYQSGHYYRGVLEQALRCNVAAQDQGGEVAVQISTQMTMCVPYQHKILLVQFI